MFKRKIYQQLLDWKKESDGQTALLVQGARRIGKSTVVEEFAKREYVSHIMIDFSKVKPEVLALFQDMSDLNYFFLQLQLLYKVNLKERQSAIIFDEVQLCPQARQAIKHLVADHRYDYMETGSLISIRKNTQDILIPSEEESINMYPMDYEEFLWALGDEVTTPLLLECFIKKKPLGDAVHRKQMQQFRLYMLVGGMPQAVEAYLNTNNFSKIDKVKRNILRLYENDFRKIDISGRASKLFEAIPAELSKNTLRYQVSKVLEQQRANDIREIFADMQDSMTVLASFHTNDPGVGMYLNMDIDRFKMFLCDTGLFTTLAFKDKEFTDNVIYEKLFHSKLATNLGYMYENIVAQTLSAKGDNLFYHTFPSETSNHSNEIDFIIARKNKICPIEVKSSGYKQHASLDRFRVKFRDRILDSYVIYTKDYQQAEGVEYVPVYMAQFL
ncbi:MAG: AAA family ATPase [Selenomonas sp.]|nr:AAA family ATPase [Selenomonadales bacterium]MDY5716249.1 AAA family ATPase [Selenomonas sp.]